MENSHEPIISRDLYMRVQEEMVRRANLHSGEKRKKRIAEMRKFLRGQDTKMAEYDEQLVRRLIEKVTVYDERFEMEFKSGVKVDVER